MQSFRAVVVTVVAGVAVSFLAATAHAQAGVPTGTSAAECVLGCNMQKKACIQGGRTVALACKADCRATSAPDQLGACMKTCRDTFRTTKDMCRTDHKSCIAGCKSGMPVAGSAAVDAACFGSCGSDLAECAQGVTGTAKDCVRGCRSAPDRLACLQDCAAVALSGAETCASDFEMCSTSCPPPTP